MKRTIRTSKAKNYRNNWPETMNFLKRRIMIQRAVIACERFFDPKGRWIGAGCMGHVKSLGGYAIYPLKDNFAARWRNKFPELFQLKEKTKCKE